MDGDKFEFNYLISLYKKNSERRRFVSLDILYCYYILLQLVSRTNIFLILKKSVYQVLYLFIIAQNLFTFFPVFQHIRWKSGPSVRFNEKFEYTVEKNITFLSFFEIYTHLPKKKLLLDKTENFLFRHFKKELLT